MHLNPSCRLQQRLGAMVLSLAGWQAACGGSSPTQPSASGGSTSGQQTQQVVVMGRVTNQRGMPLAGATVTMLGTRVPVPATTDADGKYQLAASLSGTGGWSVSAEKAGFERNVQALSSRMTQDFRLHEIVRITTGETVRVAVTGDDSLYGLEDEWRSRTVRVTAPRAGTADLEVIPEDAAGPGAIAVGAIPQYPCCPPARSVFIASGAELFVNVLITWNNATTRTFSLRTSLRPE